MANEITALKSDGTVNVDLLYIYAITTVIQVGGSNVIPTPSSGLPSDATSIVTTSEKAQLDAGTHAFEVHPIAALDSLSGADLMALVRADYVTKKAIFMDKYARVHKFLGTRINES